MTPDELKKIIDDHAKWLRNENGGGHANLSGANLRDANLSDADLRGANLDYSCWPLWCGSLDVKVDARIFRQLAYHLCRLDVDDDECRAMQRILIPLANQFHHAKECGIIESTKDSQENI